MKVCIEKGFGGGGWEFWFSRICFIIKVIVIKLNFVFVVFCLYIRENFKKEFVMVWFKVIFMELFLVRLV